MKPLPEHKADRTYDSRVSLYSFAFVDVNEIMEGIGRKNSMLISHTHRFIYTKTLKTAGTSVESFFERFCMPEGEWKQSHARDAYESSTGVIGCRRAVLPDGVKWWNHMPAASIKEQIGPEIWDDYFKFCVVRNPFDKAISAFSHLGKSLKVKKQAVSDNSRNKNMTAEQFRFFDYIRKHPPVDRDKYMIDDKFCLDDVIKYESLETDIERICDQIGVPFSKRFLPAFKTGFRSRDATLDSIYNPESRCLVAETFAFELEHFDYSFPGPAA